MKRAPFLVFVLLPAVLSMAGTPADSDITRGVKGATRLRANLGDTEGFRVSSAVVTSRGVCLEYHARLGSGFAVYKPDANQVFIDNSWIWEKDCLTGKIGQRRGGKDVTEAVNDALQANRDWMTAPDRERIPS